MICLLSPFLHSQYLYSFLLLKSICSCSIKTVWLAAPILPKPETHLFTRQWGTSILSSIVLVWPSALPSSILKGMSEMPPSKLGPGTWAIELPVLHLTSCDQMEKKKRSQTFRFCSAWPSGLPHSSQYNNCCWMRQGTGFPTPMWELSVCVSH